MTVPAVKKPAATPEERRKGGAHLNPYGRPKGVPNKIPATVKRVISNVAERLADPEKGQRGAEDAMLAWVKESDENAAIFWSRIYPKLLPLQIQGDPDRPIVTRVERVIVDPESGERRGLPALRDVIEGEFEVVDPPPVAEHREVAAVAGGVELDADGVPIGEARDG